MSDFRPPGLPTKRWFQLDLISLLLIMVCVGICLSMSRILNLASLLTMGALLIGCVLAKGKTRLVLMLLILLFLIPYCWLLFASSNWSSAHWTWIGMWPTLPGYLPSRLVFDRLPDWAIQFTSGAFTLILIAFATFVARLNDSAFWITVVSCCLLSILSSYIQYVLYRV